MVGFFTLEYKVKFKLIEAREINICLFVLKFSSAEILMPELIDYRRYAQM
jgi:hypothetical protein